jgi:adenosine deaminase CECR1
MNKLLAGILLMLASRAQAAPDRQAESFDKRFEEIKASASRQQLYELLFDLPKGGDLHNHHEYSVPMQSWLEVATDTRLLHGNSYFTRTVTERCPGEPEEPLLFATIRRATYAALPDCVRRAYKPLGDLTAAEKEAWVSSLQVQRRSDGREEFFEQIVGRLSELERDPDLIAELLVRQLQQASAEGLRYLETQADPRGSRDANGAALTEDAAAEILRQRVAQADAQRTGVALRMQVSTLRFADDAEDDLVDGYAFVHRNHDLWVGVNLVGREDNPAGQPARFLPTLRRLRRTYNDVALSLHAGESTEPSRAVRDTLLLGATRIGHGLNLLSDPDTLLLMRNGGTLIETSLVSNQLLGYAPDLAAHPFPEYLRLGIPICLNTDDRGAWDSNIVDEYFLAVTNYNLSWAEVVALGRNSLAYSFAEPALKKRLLADYDRAVAEFESRYGTGDWRALLRLTENRPSGYARRFLELGRQ